MNPHTRQQLIDSLSLKVRRRICPRCRHGLQHADVEVEVGNVSAQVGFVCPSCGHKAHGVVMLTDRIKREFARERPAEPISAAEVQRVHRILSDWHRPLTELF